jgi:hypothetical protein
MLGPHPRVRLNGVARPLPKLRFGRGARCWIAESGYGVGLAYAAGCDEGGSQGTGANARRLIGSVGCWGDEKVFVAYW